MHPVPRELNQFKRSIVSSIIVEQQSVFRAEGISEQDDAWGEITSQTLESFLATNYGQQQNIPQKNNC